MSAILTLLILAGIGYALWRVVRRLRSKNGQEYAVDVWKSERNYWCWSVTCPDGQTINAASLCDFKWGAKLDARRAIVRHSGKGVKTYKVRV